MTHEEKYFEFLNKSIEEVSDITEKLVNGKLSRTDFAMLKLNLINTTASLWRDLIATQKLSCLCEKKKKECLKATS